MKPHLKQLFSFNRRQQRGIALLLILILIASSAGWWLPLTSEPNFGETFYDDAFTREALEFLKSRQQQQKPSYNQPDHFATEPSAKKAEPVYFQFDPNTIHDQEWQKLGLSERQIKTIRNFMAKGGKFYKKEDVKRLYCINDDEYKNLEPYIKIPKPDSRPLDSTYKTSKKRAESATRYPIEINQADSSALTTITGVGPTFASRIIKYRRRLGGFVKKEQLLEIFGMDTLRYKQIEPKIVIDTNSIIKININTATFKEMLRHPYFEFYIVKTICNEREKRKGFDKKDDLLSLKLMYSELYFKIEPYICTTSD